jgi:hypothetical protein
MLLQTLQEIPDHRSPHGRRYDLSHLLLFSILAIAGGANSYRTICSFIKLHFSTLKKHYGLSWHKSPSYNCLRRAIVGVNQKSLETAFRKHAHAIASAEQHKHISLDGKTIRGSLDHFQEQSAIQVFSALLNNRIILAHETIEGNKTNEIPIAQKLIKEIGITGIVFTADAMHCQKKRCKL